MTQNPRLWRTVVTSGLVASALVAAGCAGAGGGGSDTGNGGGGDAKSINVLMVSNPQMTDIQKLTADSFTKDTGIKVNYTVLDENSLRDKVTQDVATKAGQYDVATVGAYEIPIWAKNGWLHEVGSYASKDAAYDQADLLKPIQEAISSEGKLYGLPFYGESSMLMYRKDVLKAKGVTMPEHPTWQQVADIAAKVDGAEPGMKGICLRGLPGWGEMFAPLTTVVNTYGGTWFDKDWTAKVNAPEFKKAANFYVDLVKAHGETGAAQAGFTECLSAMTQSKVAMWYDATSAAGSLEDPASSDVAGKIGYAYAPTATVDKPSGWLWTWSWVMPTTTKKADAASKFMLWATSKDYEKLVGEKLGWARVPSGKRASTYALPEYQKVASAFGDITLKSIEGANPVDPGAQPRPTVGVQYVGVPEFTDLGTEVSQQLSAVIAGKGTVDAVLDEAQKQAQAVGDKYK